MPRSLRSFYQRNFQPLETIHEHEDENDDCFDVAIRIRLTRKLLVHEFNRLNVFPYYVINIGNHLVTLTDHIPSGNKLHVQYLGLYWLFKNQHEGCVETTVSCLAMRKFIALKYGMTLFELYKLPDSMKPERLKSKLNVDVVDEDDKSQNLNDEQVSVLMDTADHKDVIIVTDDFGELKIPSDEDMDWLYDRIKVLAPKHDSSSNLKYI
jgi:hypothetical protein